MKVTIDIFDKVVNAIIQSDKTLGAIARESGVCKSTIGYWLSGRNSMTVENAQAVLAVLGKELVVMEKDRPSN